ncbi:MAG: preprotein translocase subunit YajC [Lachnospiraceae bacterium]|nr:preprotein translocase subunit YajC [Lachnospiraceae bacterium]
MTLLLSNAQAMSGTESIIYMVGWIVLLGVLMYFMFYRPQKKEQARHDSMIADIQVGDAVLTSAGFYGIIIDINDDTVIVEFGSNKNCRIPMKKSAITEVEKTGSE